MAHKYIAPDKLESISGMNRYHNWIAKLFWPYYGEKVLEAGSGLGSVSKYLPGILTLTDFDPEFVKILQIKFGGNVFVWNIENKAATAIGSNFDSVFSSNVLEHVKNDKLALKNIYSILKPGGYLLLYVPAMQTIFGTADVELGHYRRYDKNGLTKLLVDTGYKITQARYCNVFGFFYWLLRSKLFKKGLQERTLSNLLDNFVPLLNLEKFFNLPFGQNLMVIAQKI
jgi:SAM-dependent methyltransferase